MGIFPKVFVRVMFPGICLLGGGLFLKSVVAVPSQFVQPLLSSSRLSKQDVAQVLRTSVVQNQLPVQADFLGKHQEKIRTSLHYSLDPELQKTMSQLFQDYRPDYGAFVALDARTGKMLAMVSYSKHGSVVDNLALRSTFPSASIFKVVTAAAAIETRQLLSNSVIRFHGRNHTLYRGQIFNEEARHLSRFGSRFATLKEAFAHSINTVFGKIGAFTVGQDGLLLYASRFGFNHKIEADVPIQEGKALIPQDSWGLAESASGYTIDNTMSPLQGALIAAAVVNDGVMMEPYLVESVYRDDHSLLYVAQPTVMNVVVEESTAHELKKLMQETVRTGTSRSSFRGFFKKRLVPVEVGGKTGSLTGHDPHGKYDWFVGYADDGIHHLAVAALTVHQKTWRVKSAYLARRAMEVYLKHSAKQRTVVER